MQVVFQLPDTIKTETKLTTQLIEEGIDVHFEDEPTLIKNEFLEDEGTLIVYTPAIPDDHLELTFFP